MASLLRALRFPLRTDKNVGRFRLWPGTAIALAELSRCCRLSPRHPEQRLAAITQGCRPPNAAALLSFWVLAPFWPQWWRLNPGGLQPVCGGPPQCHPTFLP